MLSRLKSAIRHRLLGPPPVKLSMDEFIGQLATCRLASELHRRGAITAREANCITDGDSLAELHVDDDADTLPERLDDARALIMRGDLAEALIAIGRIHPDLSGLQYLAERRGLITHGA